MRPPRNPLSAARDDARRAARQAATTRAEQAQGAAGLESSQVAGMVDRLTGAVWCYGILGWTPVGIRGSLKYGFRLSG